MYADVMKIKIKVCGLGLDLSVLLWRDIGLREVVNWVYDDESNWSTQRCRYKIKKDNTEARIGRHIAASAPCFQQTVLCITHTTEIQ